MKVIDLLNKIANGEELPKKIMHNNIIYTWDIVGYLHYEDKHYSERAFLEGYRTDMCLNDEIEIIKDTPEEDNIQPWGRLAIEQIRKCNKVSDLKIYIKTMVQVQNEIIEKVNGE